MNQTTVRRAFWCAGIYNIGGVLLFSMFFTSPLPAKYYQVVFSDPGMIVILIWGMAYIAVSSSYMHTGKLLLVFTAEKLFYSATWLIFITEKGYMFPQIFRESYVTGMMFSLYGAGDIVFGIFFLWVWVMNNHYGESFISRFFRFDVFEDHKFLE